MIPISHIALSPKQLTKNQLDEIITLEQSHLNLSRETVLSHVYEKDTIHLYYHKTNKDLVGVSGTKEIHLKKGILVYYGNTVVDIRYKHSKCLPDVIMRSMIKMAILHPFKPKYNCALAANRASFHYFEKNTPFWPNEKEKTPKHIKEIMVEGLLELGAKETEYREEEDYVILTKYKSSNTLYKNKQLKRNCYFEKINPDYEKGELVFTISSFRLEHVINYLSIIHHETLSKNHGRTNQMKNKNSYKTLLFLCYEIYKNKILTSIGNLSVFKMMFK